MFVLEQMQLVAADVLRTEPFRRAAAVAGKRCDRGGITLQRARRVVAQAEIVEEALAEWGHGSPPKRPGAGRSKGTLPHKRPGRKSAQPLQPLPSARGSNAPRTK